MDARKSGAEDDGWGPPGTFMPNRMRWVFALQLRLVERREARADGPWTVCARGERGWPEGKRVRSVHRVHAAIQPV